MHPLVNDLAGLKDQEIHTRISDLTKKYFMTYNPDLQRQIANVLEDYRLELAERNRKLIEQQMKDKNLDNLIKVN